MEKKIVNSPLETCLEKAISEFKVRDMLTKFGIPEDAEVTLEMQIGKNPPLARLSVPNPVKKEDKKEDISRGSMSLTSLHDSLIDDFINRAINDLDLMEFIADVGGAIDDDKNKLIVSLNSQGDNYSTNFVLAGCCCCRHDDTNRTCCRINLDCTNCCPCKRN